MTYTGPRLNLLRRGLLIVDVAILVYLFALLVPIVPIQVFISTNNCAFGCPLILAHDRPVPGGFVANYLYSITRQLTGFGAHYNIDESYVLPSGLPWDNGLLTDFGVFMLLILPLSLVATTCFVAAFIIRKKQREVFRRFV
jgi:hypothetical protein